MVSLAQVQSSNARIATALPPGLVAVFVGATSGIGETSLKRFAEHAGQPRVYFIGRSKQAGDRIAAECKELNPEGEFTFIQADVSLIHTVDEVCRDIKAKETAINLLFLSTGTLVIHTRTSENLHRALALVLHCRDRFIVNLLPLLQRATALRRVVTVAAGGKEGRLDDTDFEGWNVSLFAARGHLASLVTLSLEAIAKKAPDVSFIHDFPGSVRSGLGKDFTGFAIFLLKMVLKIIGPFIYIPTAESGERHVFLATSARYSAGGDGSGDGSGVPLDDGVAVARGIDGIQGSGVYSVDWKGESASPKVESLLDGYRKKGMEDKVWKYIEGDYLRITGAQSI